MGMKEAAHLAQRARRLYEAVRPRLEAAHADGTIEAFMGTYDGARF
jgi:hypothetical protein